MITLDNVYKRFRTGNGDWHNVLNGVSFTIPSNTSVGLIGKNGAGKSTLLKLIGGVDVPTSGKITRDCKISWPMGFGGGLQGSLTGRQNAKFVCRIHGQEPQMAEKIAFMQDFAEIGEAFDRPVNTYSSGMRSRLLFAMSLAFDFEVYISDEVTAVGDETFKKKAKQAFADLIGRSSIIMVAHSPSTLKEFCSAGVWLNEGKALWFDDINEAIHAYRLSENLIAPTPAPTTPPKPKPTPAPTPAPTQKPVTHQQQPNPQRLTQAIRQQLRQARQTLTQLKANRDPSQPDNDTLKQAKQRVQQLNNALTVITSLPQNDTQPPSQKSPKTDTIVSSVSIFKTL